MSARDNATSARRRASRFHMLTVAANRLAQEHANPKLIEDLRKQAEGPGYGGRTFEVDEKRIEAQRTLFNMLPSSNAADRLKEAMLQRAYDWLWDGCAEACDALLEFLPSADVDAMLKAWDNDMEDESPKSKWHG